MTTTEAPDIVGAGESAEILGVVTPQITRWVNAGRMPKPAADLAATKVWWRKNIEQMRDGEEIENLGKLDLMGTAEAAKLLGVDKSQIGRWLRAGAFPRPIRLEKLPGGKLRAGPVWWAREVKAFNRQRRAAAVA